MSEDVDQWTVQVVRPTSVESLEGFVHVACRGEYPIFRFDGGELWKSACSIKVWDDGRVHVMAEKHLTPRQMRIVAGLAQEYWRGGPARCRREKWRRIRRTKARPVASRATCFWVRADREEPGYAAAHADQAIVVQSHAYAVDSPSHRWAAEGSDRTVTASID
jgi:hypothetical protein